ncbi:CBS domain-containing protein [Saccharopolyspora pogona]|uniref:CBS domain-containing protein n=1 Tax=Saccharopolyspora pogona TaxID=333966 RepID=UPI0016883837|nr:CBS domain-containing protein [Saccharopolyspora pogona]
MKAADIMTRPVVSVTNETSLREAIVLLTENGVGALPVIDSNNQVVGVVGESDLLRDRVADGSSTADWDSTTAVGDVMHHPARVAEMGTETDELASMMLSFGLHSIPIVDHGTLVGIVARRDLLRTLVRNDDVIASQVRHLLDSYTGDPGSWTVRVEQGQVTITNARADHTDRRVATALTRTVTGVQRVRIEEVSSAT